jgi:hypothetical protein
VLDNHRLLTMEHSQMTSLLGVGFNTFLHFDLSGMSKNDQL